MTKSLIAHAWAFFCATIYCMIHPDAIISDADGTLVDTVHLIRHGQYETAKTYLGLKGVQLIPSYEAYE